MIPVKQFGRPRSGTNYTRWIIENNFSNARVLQNIFGRKHQGFRPKNFKKAADYWLEHPNVRTDLTAAEIAKFKADYFQGSMIFVATIKPLNKYMDSLVRFNGTKLDPYDRSAVNEQIKLYNAINLNYIDNLPKPSCIINYESIVEKWEIIRSFFLDCGLELIGEARDILLKEKLAANSDIKDVRTIPEKYNKNGSKTIQPSFFTAEIREAEDKRIREVLDVGVTHKI